MRLLLDTAALIWAIESPEHLSRRAAAAIRNRQNLLEFSSISISEIAIKAARGRLDISAALLRQALEELGISVLPVTAEHAFRLFELPPHHADPFDRHIIAQALSEEIPVATPDGSFSLYKGLQVLW